MVSVCFCLIYFTKYNILYVHPWCCKWQCFILFYEWVSNIPLYWFPWWLSDEESAYQCRRHGFDSWVRKIPWRREWQPTPGFLPRKSHGQRSLTDCSPWDHQRVRHNLATKQQQATDILWYIPKYVYVYFICVNSIFLLGVQNYSLLPEVS